MQVRAHVPGFLAIERHLADWLHRKYGTVVELFYAHGLRQSPATLMSTGFAVHQDTEDYDFIECARAEPRSCSGPASPAVPSAPSAPHLMPCAAPRDRYTIVVKLTADLQWEPPSEMRVVGAPHHFQYGPAAGAAGAFKARLHHACGAEPHTQKRPAPLHIGAAHPVLGSQCAREARAVPRSPVHSVRRAPH